MGVVDVRGERLQSVEEIEALAAAGGAVPAAGADRPEPRLRLRPRRRRAADHRRGLREAVPAGRRRPTAAGAVRPGGKRPCLKGSDMKLSLSVRIVESACKSRLLVPFEELVLIARETGYDAVCMRASAAGIGTPRGRLSAMRSLVEDAGLRSLDGDGRPQRAAQQRPRPRQPARHRAEPRRGRGAGLRPDPRLHETARGHRLRPAGGGAGRPARHPAGRTSATPPRCSRRWAHAAGAGARSTGRTSA